MYEPKDGEYFFVPRNRNCTKPTQPDEYAELYEELKTIYGDLKVVKRLPRLSEVFN